MPEATTSEGRNGEDVTMSCTRPSTAKCGLHHHAAPAPAAPPHRPRVPSNSGAVTPPPARRCTL